MFQLIHESGWGAYAVLFFTLAGLAAVFTVGRRASRPGCIAAAFAVAVLAAGHLGIGTGQRNVDRYVQALPGEKIAERLEALSAGTREASANLLFSGICALLVSAVGAGAAVAMRKKPA